LTQTYLSDFWQDIKRTGGKVISLPPVLFIFSHTLFPPTLFGKTDTGMPKNHPAPNGKPISAKRFSNLRRTEYESQENVTTL